MPHSLTPLRGAPHLPPGRNVPLCGGPPGQAQWSLMPGNPQPRDLDQAAARPAGDPLRALACVSHVIGSLDFEEIFQSIVQAALDLVGASRGFLFIAGEDGNISTRIGRTASGKRLPLEDVPQISFSLVRRALQKRAPVYVQDARGDEGGDQRSSSFRFGIGSALCIPIAPSPSARMPGPDPESAAAPLLGAIYLDRQDTGRPLSAEDLGLFQALGDLAAAALVNAALYHDAIVDAPTGLAHRRHFERTLEAEMQKARAARTPLALLLIDLDGFHELAEMRGAVAAEEALRRAAAVLRADGSPSDLVARYAGHTFAVLLPGRNTAASGAIAELRRAALERTFASDPGLRLTASAGAAEFDAARDASREDFVLRADLALLASQQSGRNRATLWSPALARAEGKADELRGLFSGEPARDYETMRLLLEVMLDACAAEGATADRLARILQRILHVAGGARATLFRPAARGLEPWITGRRGAPPPGEADHAADAERALKGLAAPPGHWAGALRREGETAGVLVVEGPPSTPWPRPHERALLDALGPQLALLIREGLLRDAHQQAVEAERATLARENERLADRMRRQGMLVGECPAMRELFSTIRRVAPSTATVLLTGESGTGKEALARLLHDLSPRASAPYVVVDCSGIPKDLVESELFGHEKGAFTGATETRKGLLETADGGTVFLDEVSELPEGAQAKLLRFLQESETRRIGSTERRKLDVRIVAATNVDLEARSREGSFRRDLLYRLRVIAVNLPPLRARSDDILLLAEHFLRRFCRQERRWVEGFEEEAVAAMKSWDWPGNVRELEHRIHRAVLLGTGPRVRAAELELARADAAPGSEGLRGRRDQVESQMVERALRDARGNVAEAARILHVSRSALQRTMRRLGMDRGNFVEGGTAE